MNRNKILVGVGVIALLGVGYLIYRKIRTTSQSTEKNSRKIRIIGTKNVTPTEDDIDASTETQTEI
jgi:hypothetical protein